MGRLEELTNSQRLTLARMGVQLYYTRKRGEGNAVASKDAASPSTAVQKTPSLAVETQAEPPSALVAAPDPLPNLAGEASTFAEIKFVWVRGAAGILLVEQLHDDFKPFIRDLIGFLDWRAGVEPKPVRNGRFQWPKLDGHGGSPAGSMRAFKEKYFGNSNQWIVTTPELAARLETYLLEDHDGAIHKIDEPSAALTGEAKRKLWCTLTS